MLSNLYLYLWQQFCDDSYKLVICKFSVHLTHQKRWAKDYAVNNKAFIKPIEENVVTT